MAGSEERPRRVLLSVGTSVFDPTLVARNDRRSGRRSEMPRDLAWFRERVRRAGLSNRELLHASPLPDPELHAEVEQRSARLRDGLARQMRPLPNSTRFAWSNRR
ncbi:MAG TPA: hypothetical protein EYH34_06735 [Planctomycetes bacterium]|nr:hypothetical protein [Planctomycetota bacterium]